MKKIIALSAFKQSGKDTAADYLIEYHGFTRAAFADSLKDMVAKEFSISRKDCDDPNKKEMPISHMPVTPKDDFSLNLCKYLFLEFRTINGHQAVNFNVDISGAFMGLVAGARGFQQLFWTPRALCILKGSTNRTVNSDYWVSKTIQDIEDSNNEYFVISDMRYKNELNQLKEAFGTNLVSVRINRFDSTNSIDPSENDLTGSVFDVTIENKGSIEDYIEKLRDLAINVRKV